MSESKLYWLKLYDSFFTSDNVDLLMSQKNGEKLVIIYQLCCLKSLKTGGILGRQLGQIFMPYDAEKLKRDFKWFTLKEIEEALNWFEKLDLIHKTKDNCYLITDFEKMIGSETKWAQYKRSKKEIGKSPTELQCDFQKNSKQSKSKSKSNTTITTIKGNCLLGFDKKVKVDWCFLNCKKCAECQVPTVEPVKLIPETEVDEEIKALLDSAIKK